MFIKCDSVIISLRPLLSKACLHFQSVTKKPSRKPMQLKSGNLLVRGNVFGIFRDIFSGSCELYFSPAGMCLLHRSSSKTKGRLSSQCKKAWKMDKDISCLLLAKRNKQNLNHSNFLSLSLSWKYEITYIMIYQSRDRIQSSSHEIYFRLRSKDMFLIWFAIIRNTTTWKWMGNWNKNWSSSWANQETLRKAEREDGPSH